MTDITERLRELSKARWDRDAWERETTVRIPAEPDRDIDLVLASAAELIDRLRARVAELETVEAAARVAELERTGSAVVAHHIRGYPEAPVRLERIVRAQRPLRSEP